jgi:transcriptional regulator with XRE-family HTH domain
MPRIRQYAAKYAMADFGSHIKGRIQNSGLKQADVGEKLGISQQGVSRLLNHPEKITVKQLREICGIVEIDSQVLLKAIGIKEDKHE